MPTLTPGGGGGGGGGGRESNNSSCLFIPTIPTGELKAKLFIIIDF